MLNVERALQAGKFTSRLLLQVHDELILEVISKEVEEVSALVRREMGAAFPLLAPLDVSVGIGSSWNEAAH
jgi:DNA polymerase-1